jgi:hypothetical protein
LSNDENPPDAFPNYTKAVIVWNLPMRDLQSIEIPQYTHSEIENLLEIIENHALQVGEIKKII